MSLCYTHKVRHSASATHRDVPQRDEEPEPPTYTDTLARGGVRNACDRCSRVYESSDGTGAISWHLRKAHSIDTTASGVARKTTRERPVTDAAVYREPKEHTKAEEAREEPTPISLDIITLQRVYFSWFKSRDQHFALVNNTAFRNLLQYISLVLMRCFPI